MKILFIITMFFNLSFTYASEDNILMNSAILNSGVISEDDLILLSYSESCIDMYGDNKLSYYENEVTDIGDIAVLEISDFSKPNFLIAINEAVENKNLEYMQPDYVFPIDLEQIELVQEVFKVSAKERYDREVADMRDIVNLETSELAAQNFGAVSNGTAYRLNDSEQNMSMFFKVYHLPEENDDKAYIRIPVTTKQNLCGIFSLGFSDNDVILALLKKHELMDEPIDFCHEIFQDIADLYNSNIKIYFGQKSDEIMLLMEFNPKEMKAEETKRIFLRPGHYNALVAQDNLEKIKEFMLLNKEHENNGWFPIFAV